MGKYLRRFATNAEFEAAYNGEEYVEPWTSLTDEDGEVNFNQPEDFSKKPLTFEILSNGNILWTVVGSEPGPYPYSMANAIEIEYSKDSGTTWTSITSTTVGTSITVKEGDVVQLRGNAAPGTDTTEYNSFSGTTAGFKVYGNIMSLVDSTGFATATTLGSDYEFYSLFGGCTGLADASNLVLPATSLKSNCYQGMFQGCTSLTAAPELPAIRLATSCYNSMFRGCTGLITGPSELPAIMMTVSACTHMFNGCTGLTAAPALPATTLLSYCYSYMFNGCTSLTTAPELPATALTSNCYAYMFSGCTSLNYIKALFTTTPSTTYTRNWVSGVALSGTFVKNSAATWTTTGVNGVPEGWTVEGGNSGDSGSDTGHNGGTND